MECNVNKSERCCNMALTNQFTVNKKNNDYNHPTVTTVTTTTSPQPSTSSLVVSTTIAYHNTPKPCGIRNSTGTACHWNAAWIIWRHCLGATEDLDNKVQKVVAMQPSFNEFNIRGEENIDDSNTTNTTFTTTNLLTSECTNPVQILQQFWHELGNNEQPSSNNNKVVVVDPSMLYKMRFPTSTLSQSQQSISQLLQQEVMLGDAITTLYQWVQFVEECCPDPTKIRREWLWYTGRVQSVLQQWDCVSSSSSSVSKITQSKFLKVKVLSNPIKVPIQKQIKMEEETEEEMVWNLESCLHRLWCEPEILHNYQWCPDASSKTMHKNTTNDSSSSSRTVRRQHVHQFPPILMLHLERFWYNRQHNRMEPIQDNNNNNNNNTTSKPQLVIPEYLNMQKYLSTAQDKRTTDSCTEPNDIQPMEKKNNEEEEEEESLSSSSSSSLLLLVPPSTMYLLMGGILYVNEIENECMEHGRTQDTTTIYEVDGFGHYVAVMKQPQQGNWYLINDEIVTNVTTEQVLYWLGGGWYNPQSKTRDTGSSTTTTTSTIDSCSKNIVQEVVEEEEEEDRNTKINSTGLSSNSFLRGVLLVYHCENLLTMLNTMQQQQSHERDRHENSTNTNPNIVKNNNSNDNKSDTNNQKPSPLPFSLAQQEELIGRRARVRWKGGKYYRGVVTGYNAKTKQHTVLYDDGDIRHYRLEQKTLEWLD